jgi:hypothetical protein
MFWGEALSRASPQIVGARRIDAGYFDFGNSWRRVVALTPRLLYPRGKSAPHPSDRRLAGPQNRSRRYGEGKIFYPTETSVVQPVASRYTNIPFVHLAKHCYSNKTK